MLLGIWEIHVLILSAVPAGDCRLHEQQVSSSAEPAEVVEQQYIQNRLQTALTAVPTMVVVVVVTMVPSQR